MQRSKRTKRRLRLYMRSIQIEIGELNALTKYAELDPEQRKLARRTGRQLIWEAGSVAKAAAALKTQVVQQSTASRGPSVVAARNRAHFRQKKFDHIRQGWSPLTPACPSCRMGIGFPKRSWPTREWAEEVWAKQHDRHLMRVYACPVQPGFWHLGHLRSGVVSAANREKASLIPGEFQAITSV
jgi:hypothetical protein